MRLLIDIYDIDTHNAVMATLNFRNLPNLIHACLHIRAAKAGHSMDVEARQLTTEAQSDNENVISITSLQALIQSQRLTFGDLSCLSLALARNIPAPTTDSGLEFNRFSN